MVELPNKYRIFTVISNDRFFSSTSKCLGLNYPEKPTHENPSFCMLMISSYFNTFFDCAALVKNTRPQVFTMESKTTLR